MTYVVGPLQRTVPRHIVFTISGGSIQYDNGDSTGLQRDKVWARAGSKAVFVVQNNDEVSYDVTIPFDEFKPKKNVEITPQDPINKHATGKNSIAVGPGDVDVLVYVINDAAHFPFSEVVGEFTYEFEVRYRKSGMAEMAILDPDLEVTP